MQAIAVAILALLLVLFFTCILSGGRGGARLPSSTRDGEFNRLRLTADDRQLLLGKATSVISATPLASGETVFTLPDPAAPSCNFILSEAANSSQVINSGVTLAGDVGFDAGADRTIGFGTTVAQATRTLSILGSNSVAGQNGGNLVLQAGAGDIGGNLTATSGASALLSLNSTGQGGSIQVNSNNPGGSVQVNSTGAGGTIQLTSSSTVQITSPTITFNGSTSTNIPLSNLVLGGNLQFTNTAAHTIGFTAASPSAPFPLTIAGNDSTASGQGGGQVTIQAGGATGTASPNLRAGLLNLSGGTASSGADAGGVSAFGGQSDSGRGGNANLTGGKSTSGNAGSVNLTGGTSTSGTGGSVNLTPGTGSTAGAIQLGATGSNKPSVTANTCLNFLGTYFLANSFSKTLQSTLGYYFFKTYNFTWQYDQGGSSLPANIYAARIGQLVTLSWDGFQLGAPPANSTAVVASGLLDSPFVPISQSTFPIVIGGVTPVTVYALILSTSSAPQFQNAGATISSAPAILPGGVSYISTTTS